jgi:4-amino-4-deoxy-L-arabinose transferase-like glycosyltransferase
LNVLFGVLTCWCIFGIGRALAGRTAGLLATFLAAIYKPFVLFSVTILKESFGLWLFASVTWLFLAELEEPSRWRGPVLGVMAGLLLNVRQNAVVALVVIVPVLVIKAAKRRRAMQPALATALGISVGFLLATAPFMVANYRGTGWPSPAPLGGFDLYIGNHLDGATPYYNPVPFAGTNPDQQGIQFTIEASRRVGRKLTLGEASAYWANEVLRSARLEPGAFAWRLGWKLLAIFNRAEESDNQALEFMGAFVGFFRLPLLAFWLVMPLGVGWLIAAARRNPKATALGGIFLLYTATMVAVFSNMRIRAPLVLLAMPCAAAAVLGLLKLGSRIRTSRGALVLAAGAIAVVEFLPLRGTGDLTAHYNTHAVALSAHGRSGEASLFWQKSIEMKGVFSPYAGIALAYQSLARGDSVAARGWLDKVPDQGFAAATKLSALGDVLLAQGRPAEAAAAYEHSLSINWGQVDVRRKLIRVYGVINPAKAEAARAAAADVREFYGLLARWLDA